MKVYHASIKELDNIVLLPRVPKNVLKNENTIIKRICFCSSINGCFTAIDNLVFHDHVYVYEAEIEPFSPSSVLVPDVFLTGEVWSLETVCDLKLIGIALITGYIGCEINDEVNNQYSYKWEIKG